MASGELHNSVILHHKNNAKQAMAGAQSRPAPNTSSHYNDLDTSTPTSPSTANDWASQLGYKKRRLWPEICSLT